MLTADILDSNGWETEYDANFNTTEDVSLTMKP